MHKYQKSRESPTVGIYGTKEGNDRGDRLMEFAESTKMYIMNTFYMKKSWEKIHMEESRRGQKWDRLLSFK